MTIRTEQGNTFTISKDTYDKLSRADNARVANDVFDDSPIYIPRRHRNDVWQAIPADESLGILEEYKY